MKPLGRESPQIASRSAFGRYNPRTGSLHGGPCYLMIKGLHFPGCSTRPPASQRPIIERGVARACRQGGRDAGMVGASALSSWRGKPVIVENDALSLQTCSSHEPSLGSTTAIQK